MHYVAISNFTYLATLALHFVHVNIHILIHIHGFVACGHFGFWCKFGTMPSLR